MNAFFLNALSPDDGPHTQATEQCSNTVIMEKLLHSLFNPCLYFTFIISALGERRTGPDILLPSLSH